MKINMKTPLVEIDGDEMTRIIWKELKDELILPYIDLKTEYYDLGLKNRDLTSDKVTVDAANAIKRLGVGVKCATITPNEQRMSEYSLHEKWKSPNGTIRAILDGTVFRAPIVTESIEPVVKGWTKPITIARHAYGDIYKATEYRVKEEGKAELVFTSKNGVRSFFYNLDLAGADIRLIANARFAVVGKATEKELAKHHIKADVIPMEQTGKGLADAMKLCMPYAYGGSDDNISDKMCKVCIFSAKEASPDLEAGLKGICELEKIDAYVNEQADESISESIGNSISEAVFTSASNVDRFFDMLPENTCVETAYSIGEKTTAALEQYNVREIVQADDSSYEALVDKISN